MADTELNNTQLFPTKDINKYRFKTLKRGHITSKDHLWN